jgi:leucyl aminopeptidase
VRFLLTVLIVGYNLKVGASMIELMKFDMGGCGAVLGTAKAIAQIKPSVRVL